MKNEKIRIAKNFSYQFSFVMPVYKVEAYLEETIESIVAQTIGFEDNCEIIFINDGSPDNSDEICLKYKKKYPDNIKYIKQENQGLSAARNVGLDLADGKYVSLLDSDDTLSPDTLEKVVNFFDDNYEDIDFVSIPIYFFEAKTGPHQLNEKFNRTQIIDIEKTPDALQLSAASTFIKNEVLRHGWRFDAEIKRYGEDANFLSKLVLEKMKYGVVSEASYNYRKRNIKGSILDGERTDKTWYLTTPNLSFGSIFSYAEKRLGYIPEYIQRVVMYDLQWRLNQASQNVLSESERQQYICSIISLLKKINDKIIFSQKNLNIEHKVLALNLKYDTNVLQNAVIKDNKCLYKETELQSYDTERTKAFIQIVETKGMTIEIEGLFKGLLCNGVELGFLINRKYYPAEKDERPNYEVKFLDKTFFDRNPFKLRVEASIGDTIQPVIKFDNGTQLNVGSIEFGHISRLANHNYAYRVDDKLILQNIDNRAISLQKRSFTQIIKRELLFCRSLIKDRTSGKSKNIPKIINYRLASGVGKLLKQKQIWIVSDRPESAGDNGEALYRYLVENTPKNVKVYYTISKDSQDYETLKKIGPVVDRYSMKYKLLFLMSDKIISSMADDYVINAFGDDRFFIHDLYHFDFVFLQHGITKDDISRWLGRYSKNIKLFITAAKPEYEDLLTKKYGYNKNIVKLTGFPRYDLLESNPTKKIILAPTWRSDLLANLDSKSLTRSYDESFVESDYYKYYQSLIEDKTLNMSLKNYGYTAIFVAHPALVNQICDFNETNYFKVGAPPNNYKDIFKEGSILITDYSSVAFDFAYLRKPVIYTQFDKEKFYESHLYDKGYFSYEKNGFGPVVNDLNTSVQKMIKYIENDAVIDSKYLNRIERFFAYNDKNNSRRVVEAILEME